jgi:ribosomal protein S27AE
MKRTREQIKAELMKKAEEEIDRLLSWEAKTAKPTLTQFEDQVMTARRVLSEAMLESLMTGQENCQPAERVVCPKCGQVVKNKGTHSKQVETRAGSLRLKRQYEYCPHCREGFFPLG